MTVKWILSLTREASPAALLPVALFSLVGGITATAYLASRATEPECDLEPEDESDRQHGRASGPASVVPPCPTAPAADDGRDVATVATKAPLAQTPGLVRTAYATRGARLGKFSSDARAKVDDPRPLQHRGRVFEEADVARHNLLHPRNRWSLTGTNAKAVDATVDGTGQPIQHKVRYGYLNEKASAGTKLSTNRAMHRKALRDLAGTTGRTDGVVRTTRGGGTGIANVQESPILEDDLFECIGNEWRASNFARVCGERAIEAALVASVLAALGSIGRIIRGESTPADEAGNVFEAALGAVVAALVTTGIAWIGGTLLLDASLVAAGAPMAGLVARWLFDKVGAGRLANRIARKMAQAVGRLATRVGTPVAKGVARSFERIRRKTRDGVSVATRFAARVRRRLQCWCRRWLGPPGAVAPT